MKGRRRVVIVVSVLVVFLVVLHMTRPPGQPPEHEDIQAEPADSAPLVLSHGNLPGITWVDDIHPIFIRNKCSHCHTRGKEAIAEGFEELALGIIDPDDEGNAFYSYHELVYAEGPPQFLKGETLRDGQCCWPRNYPPEKQRRIWIGHPERSVLMRKLEHDYYDWDKPPRFFEEGIDIEWGPPMPMYHEKKRGKEYSRRHYNIRPFYKRIFLHLSLWLGGSRDELHQWPPRILESDRLLLRSWIYNAVQLMADRTGIEVQALDTTGNPVENATVKLVGNHTSIEKKEIDDQIVMTTDIEGKAVLLFPQYSVITSTWFVASEKDSHRAEYRPIRVEEGKIKKVSLQFK